MQFEIIMKTQDTVDRHHDSYDSSPFAGVTRGIGVGVLILAMALGLARCDKALAAVAQTNIRIPSDSTGNGTLAVRIFFPDNASAFRYGASAGGALAASDGRSISQIVSGPVRTDAVGLIALSNGGSISVAALGRYGEQIPPLAFLVGWESPTNDQILTTEMGSKEVNSNQSIDSDCGFADATYRWGLRGLPFHACCGSRRRCGLGQSLAFSHRASG